MELSSVPENSGREGEGMILFFILHHVSLNLNLTHAGKTCTNLSVPEVLIKPFPSFFIGPVGV